MPRRPSQEWGVRSEEPDPPTEEAKKLEQSIRTMFKGREGKKEILYHEDGEKASIRLLVIPENGGGIHTGGKYRGSKVLAPVPEGKKDSYYEIDGLRQVESTFGRGRDIDRTEDLDVEVGGPWAAKMVYTAGYTSFEDEESLGELHIWKGHEQDAFIGMAKIRYGARADRELVELLQEKKDIQAAQRWVERNAPIVKSSNQKYPEMSKQALGYICAKDGRKEIRICRSTYPGEEDRISISSEYPYDKCFSALLYRYGKDVLESVLKKLE